MTIVPHTPSPLTSTARRWAPRIYPGETAQAARVRAELRTDLAGLPGISDDLVETVVLCASEAFANAAEHTRSGDPGGRVVRALHIPTPGTIRLVIVDDGDRGNRPEVPHARSAEEWETAERGRGLLLVESLATEWGAAPVVSFPFCAELGTSVWAEFPLNPR
ncbi:anti-sigma regulatory factor (Ser/Thr protein kinase) [Murinocardiopsis flavida]|uniref:Anti-sigma regulatory factor (Ser/Thr protein kinase) n=1 Tax=Murinocardiopsis flavida TaxID=645275 RepID=A0A2P8CWT7_9ACTN|nr:ATP-binding protein [Murinocardiopsis flavida]PSK89407.1 anti-sigma regulatory factor (Ser/Thr protein kinase) [Murinocardiopsis flavida]